MEWNLDSLIDQLDPLKQQQRIKEAEYHAKTYVFGNPETLYLRKQKRKKE